MSTKPLTAAEVARRTPYSFPDPPPPEDMNNYLYLTEPGYPPALVEHFGDHDTNIVIAEVYISHNLPETQGGLLYPDLLIAFDIDREAVIARKGFVINEQGKPPDFVLEIGSESTGLRDVTIKRDGYAALGVQEYWRFDPSGGRFHRGAALAGDRLVNGRYEPIPIQQTDEGDYRGYSAALGLELRSESGRLLWYDLVAQQYLPTFYEVIDGRDAAVSQRDAAVSQRDAAVSQRDAAVSQRDAAEAQRDDAVERVRQLEEQLRRQQNPGQPETP